MYRVTAPLVIADGGYFYRNAIIAELPASVRDRLVRRGMIEAVSDAPTSVETANVAAAEPDSVSGEKATETVAAPEKPQNTDLKSEWVKYGIRTGKLRSEAEGDGYTKPELIELLS